MRRIFVAAISAVLLAPFPASAITIDTELVGDPFNPRDPGQFGRVEYVYRIGTYEVTNAQYAEFLNAKAKSDPLGLYDSFMHGLGGIVQSGESGNFNYSIQPNMGNKPVNYVSWYDAIRFANWLHNGQGSGDTETGAYTLGTLGANGVPTAGMSIRRNSGAAWFLTSEDEWYKAAYYQPAAQGGDADNYWLYPTASNIAPTLATANSLGDISNPGANVANYNFGAHWNGRNGNVTTVGSAGLLSASFYGTFDQGGNVFEWNEGIVGGIFRGFRGASWSSEVRYLMSMTRDDDIFPYESGGGIGFRVATLIGVPEPSTLALAALGAAGLLIAARRR